MKNHDEKIKDMVESVLPSTARKSARDRRRIVHKRARAHQRVALADVTVSCDDVCVDFRDGRRKSELHWIVLDRRGADNVGALTRWAVAVVDSDPTLRRAPLHVQVGHFASLLPADVIGQHAVQHIEWALKYRANRPSRAGREVSWQARAAQRRRTLVDDLRRVMATGHHGDFNDALRRVYGDQAPTDAKTVEPRYLLGWHDIDAFAEESAGADWVHDLAHTLG